MHQYVSDAPDFDSLIEALEKIYTKKKNVFATRNKLLSCRQSSNENVKTYLQRLNNLAKHCKFTRPSSVEQNRAEWVSQQFISGLVSREMRHKILERELTDPEEVYSLADVLERSQRETQQFDNVRIQKTGMAETQLEAEEDPNTPKEVNAAKVKGRNG